MALWGFWALVGLIAPALTEPAPGRLALGLAVAFAAVLVIAALRPAPTVTVAAGVRAFARRARTAVRPRLVDPDAAGRPRARAPGRRSAAA
jgi:uncharacterized protein DUF6412